VREGERERERNVKVQDRAPSQVVGNRLKMAIASRRPDKTEADIRAKHAPTDEGWTRETDFFPETLIFRIYSVRVCTEFRTLQAVLF
jgi:hypothetical protein